ncbi:MAG TPA: cell division protein SepF [Patescibacteria group bacterium]|nr:cell division protein SepF [Patescibacteria group bacterium]
MAFDILKKAFGQKSEVPEEEYLEIDLEKGEKDKKIIVKPFVLKVYEDTNEILNAIRDGFTIAIIDIKSLRQKDSIELKRAISKIKKTVDALEGSIAGFGENLIIATPSFATIHKEQAKPKEEPKRKFDL